MAFVFLFLVSLLCVKNIWALFRVEATIGWIGEDIVVQTTNDMLPLSISFTELAWQALITFRFRVFGRKSLLFSDTWSVLKLTTTIGIFYSL